jgi:hypothetical protein
MTAAMRVGWSMVIESQDTALLGMFREPCATFRNSRCSESMLFSRAIPQNFDDAIARKIAKSCSGTASVFLLGNDKSSGIPLKKGDILENNRKIERAALSNRPSLDCGRLL